MDWKSGGDTKFVPLVSADGEMECHGGWEHGEPEKRVSGPDNRKIAPSWVRYVDAIGANFCRVRVIEPNPSDEERAVKPLHIDDKIRLNPEGSGEGEKSGTIPLPKPGSPSNRACSWRSIRGGPPTRSTIRGRIRISR